MMMRQYPLVLFLFVGHVNFILETPPTTEGVASGRNRWSTHPPKSCAVASCKMWWTILGTAAATLGAAVIVANTSWVL